MWYSFAVEQLESQQETTRTHPHRAGQATWWLLALYSAFLLAATSYVAAHRHLWFDEIDTFFIGTLPSLKAIWNILLLGTDGQPIGFYIPVHLSYLLFGSSELALRLCAIIPFWLTTLVLYYAVARRTAPLYGFIAALAPPFTVAFQYSFEARPYALVLLFSACSFLAWQFAKEGRMRALSIPAIAITLGAAISVHYNAVLVVIPILIGELAHTVRKRKIDVPVLIAICASGIPILFLLPHIHAVHVYSKSYWSHSTFSALSDIYFVLSAKFIVLTMLACAAFGFWVSLSTKRLRGVNPEFGRLPTHELAAAGGYLLLPLACFVLSFYTKALHYRYVIATVIGLSLFVPFVLWIFRSLLSKAAGLLCALLVLNLLYTSLSRVRAPDEDAWGTFEGYSELFNPATKDIYQSKQALVLGDGPFLVVAKYGSADLRERSFYLLSKSTSTNTSPVVFRGLRSAIHGPFHLADVKIFEQTHRSFLMYNPDIWLLNQLLAEGSQVGVVKNLPHGFLYEVTLKR